MDYSLFSCPYCSQSLNGQQVHEHHHDFSGYSMYGSSLPPQIPPPSDYLSAPQSAWNSLINHSYPMSIPTTTSQYMSPQLLQDHLGYTASSSESRFTSGNEMQYRSDRSDVRSSQPSGTTAPTSSELLIYPYGVNPPRVRIIQACQKCRASKAKVLLKIFVCVRSILIMSSSVVRWWQPVRTVRDERSRL